ncbi:hypothetical protein V5799_025074 [Amblyomma americanum]|uniref:Uncharacterized protein n=1 Tax=Amblyomma americanum TaxID=6943 RepID=A0AAQ4EAL4_AMBAM
MGNCYCGKFVVQLPAAAARPAHLPGGAGTDGTDHPLHPGAAGVRPGGQTGRLSSLHPRHPAENVAIPKQPDVSVLGCPLLRDVLQLG